MGNLRKDHVFGAGAAALTGGAAGGALGMFVGGDVHRHLLAPRKLRLRGHADVANRRSHQMRSGDAIFRSST